MVRGNLPSRVVVDPDYPETTPEERSYLRDMVEHHPGWQVFKARLMKAQVDALQEAVEAIDELSRVKNLAFFEGLRRPETILASMLLEGKTREELASVKKMPSDEVTLDHLSELTKRIAPVVPVKDVKRRVTRKKVAKKTPRKKAIK